MIDHYLSVWSLIPDGDLITTATSRLLPVRYENTPAMLKVASTTEERRGNHLMAWWKGEGAAQVLKLEGDAI